jgi:acyl carrier protein
MNFLDLLNRVTVLAKPAHHDFTPLDNMATPFTETEIDSLDGMMIVMYIAIIYGIPDDDVKEFTSATPQELFDFVEQHKTKTPESIEQAMSEVA